MCKNCIKVFIIITAILSICFSFTISSFAGNDSEIFFYNGTTIGQLTDNDNHDWTPQINNSGEVVWYGYDGNDYEIFFYDGTTIIQLTDNDYNDVEPRVNDSGEVVWYSTNLDAGGGGGGAGGGFDIGTTRPCLISTAAYGFRMSMETLTLALLFVSMLIVFYKIRAKFKK